MTTYGGFQFNKIQMGRESTAGTAVAATTIWRGDFAMLRDERTRNIVTEQVGVNMNGERSYDTWLLGRLSMPATPLTFEQLPHLLEAGIGTVSPSGADPYVYAYSIPTGTSLNTLKTYTIEGYNTVADADMQEMAHCYVESISLSASAGEAWTMAAEWVGAQLSNTTPTSLTTQVAVQEALLARTSLFIDATGGTIGSTQKSGVLMGADLTINTGVAYVPVGDGNLYYSALKFTPPSIEFSLTFELEDDSGTSLVDIERAIYASDAVRLIRLDIDGSDSDRQVRVDMAAKYDSVGGYDNADGNTTVTFTGHVVNSTTDSQFFDVTVTNKVASLP